MLLLILLPSILISLDFEFSNYSIPVEVNGIELNNPFSGGHNRPRLQWWDWDLDNDKDLFILDESGYIRYYKNNSNGDNFDFIIQSCRFNNIYAGNWFYFGDFDSDGDPDLMTQNEDYFNNVTYYENIGYNFVNQGILITNSNEFVISDPQMTPCFSDIDNDGDLDFFTGNAVGTITFYENLGFSENYSPQFEYKTNFWQEISIIGPSIRHGASALAFIDLDGDLDLDLAWGDYFQHSLYVISNIGTVESPQMDVNNILQQYPFENPIISAGQNMPSFVDIDSDGDQDLFISVLSGAYGSQMVNNFYYYNNVGNENYPIFQFETNNFLDGIDLLSHSTTELYDIDNDGDYDLFVGTKSDPTQPNWSGKINFFENIGSVNNPYFILDSDPLFDDLIGYNIAITFGDLNQDGWADIIVGDSNGMLRLYFNNGNSDFLFDSYIDSIDLSGNSDPELIDIDQDEDLDLLVGEANGNISLYLNDSYNNFELITENFFGDLNITYSTVEANDYDNDGDFDFFIGSYNSGITFLENIGNNIFVSDIENSLLLGNYLSCSVNDLNSDGIMDMLIGSISGGVFHIEIDRKCYKGDLNVDNILNILDIILMVNVILNEVINDENEFCRSDMNDDGDVNIFDVVILVSSIHS